MHTDTKALKTTIVVTEYDSMDDSFKLAVILHMRSRQSWGSIIMSSEAVASLMGIYDEPENFIGKSITFEESPASGGKGE